MSAVNTTGTSAPGPEFPESRYAVIDLGTNMTPLKITDSGYVLMQDGSGNYYRFQNGAAVPLVAGSGDSFTVNDMTEDGTAVGVGTSGGASVQFTWSGTNGTAVTSAPAGGSIYRAWAGVGPHVWSKQTGPASGYAGYYDNARVGPYTVTTGVVQFTNPPPRHIQPPSYSYAVGVAVVPLMANAVGDAICQTSRRLPDRG